MHVNNNQVQIHNDLVQTLDNQVQVHNDPLQIKLRRCENILIITGAAVVVFSLWSITKAAFYLFLNSVDFIKEIGGLDQELLDQMGAAGQDLANALIYVFVFLIMMLDLLFRFYIGRSAIAEGRGRIRKKRKRIMYVISAVVLSLFLLLSIRGSIIIAMSDDVESGSLMMDSITASIILDCTSLLAFVEMIISGIRVHLLRNKLQLQAADADAGRP